MILDLAIKLALVGIVFFGVLNLAGLHTWIERKQSAIIQDRIGANRASIFGFRLMGLFHPLADAVKMFTKEDIIPAGADRVLHTLAPFFSVFFALVAFAGIPFGDRLVLGDRVIELQVAKIDVALLYVFAMLSLGVYGVILAGFASRNNYAMLGGLRATAQMISYEIALGIAIIGVIMVYGTLDLQEIVRGQGRYLWGWIPFWGIVVQPVAFFVFVTAALAETKRIPFDMPEGESEVIGYFVEYSGMKFGMFFLADFLETIMVACLVTTLFLGGWQVPYLMPDGFHFPWGAIASRVILGLRAPRRGELLAQGPGVLLAVHADPLDAAALSLRSADDSGLEGAVSDCGGQRSGDGPRADVFRWKILMGVKVLRRRELTFWEELYVPQIISGLKITSVHFFRNLFRHAAHSVGLLKHLAASATFQYPEEPRPLAWRFRSRHRLTVREEGTPRCVGCMLCETVCPARCITIVAGEHPDPNVEKYPVRFDIDLGICVYCGYCVEVCPEDAIRMDTGILDVAAYSRDQMKLDIHELMDPALRKPVTGCSLKFPHECRHTPGQTKGSWDEVYGREGEPTQPST